MAAHPPPQQGGWLTMNPIAWIPIAIAVLKAIKDGIEE